MRSPKTKLEWWYWFLGFIPIYSANQKQVRYIDGKYVATMSANSILIGLTSGLLVAGTLLLITFAVRRALRFRNKL